MIKGILSIITTTTFVLLARLATHSTMAQNATNVMKNVTNTASEIGQKALNAMGNASATANQTMSEAGKNAAQTGQNLLNQAGELERKLGQVQLMYFLTLVEKLKMV